MIFKKNVPYFYFSACWIAIPDGIIQAIRKHIIAEDALSGGSVYVGVYESAEGGIVVAGLEVIESCFGIVVVAAVAQGVMGAQVGTASFHLNKHRG